MKSLKEKWQQFRQWQREPLHYKQLTNKKRLCHNCGLKYVGDYCPRCSQSAKVGKKIGWETIRSGFMETFNIESRSLPRTLLHLLLRPGYLISDYISGRRQMSYPPLKMLVIVALCLVVTENLSNWIGGEEATHVVVASEGGNDFLDKLGTWIEANPGWALLALNCLLILPTWLLFRYAPRHSHHTLPESFFIQVFMTILVLLMLILSYISDWLLLLVLFYYILTYCQLFGYGLWGTLWRMAVVMFEVFIIFIFLAMLGIGMKSTIFHELGGSSIGAVIAAMFFIFLIGAAVAFIAHVINKRTSLSPQK